MIRASYHFPQSFLWGTATSSHQVEGDNRDNDWWDWEQEADRILHGHKSGKACDWWAGRWAEDFDRAAGSFQNAHRMSIEWSRVEPSPAVWDEAAIERYREIILGAVERGLTPMVTLHHFTNPRWVAERGGWLNPEIDKLFQRYVEKVVAALKDIVKIWITINEPNVYAYSAFVEGVFPPGKRDLRTLPTAIRHLIRAHAAAYHAIHRLQPTASVGLAHHYRGFEPAEGFVPINRMIARYRSRWFNDVFPRAVTDGKIRFLKMRESIPEARGTQDFFGLNYYTVEQVSVQLRRLSAIFQAGGFSDDADLSPTGWIANKPEGFWDALRWAHAYGKPIYVTENGIEDSEDVIRPRYLASHLQQLWRAVNFNWRVKGYFHWTLVDNFEWERGWTQRFGLWALDPRTQERTKRPSADFFAEVCKENALSSDLVRRFAPEVQDQLFPPRGPAELVERKT